MSSIFIPAASSFSMLSVPCSAAFRMASAILASRVSASANLSAASMISSNVCLGGSFKESFVRSCSGGVNIAAMFPRASATCAARSGSEFVMSGSSRLNAMKTWLFSVQRTPAFGVTGFWINSCARLNSVATNNLCSAGFGVRPFGTE